MSGATVRCTFVPAPKPAPGRAAPKAVRSPRPSGPSRAARMLALAHYVEHQIEDDAIRDYASAADALGVTRARLSQVMSLLLLAPEIQEALLTGKTHASERSLRAVVREPVWVLRRQNHQTEDKT